MQLKPLLLSIFTLCGLQSMAQFAPQVPLAGNTGIAQNDDQFADWASGCTVKRGWLDIADTSLGKPTLGTENDAVGFPNNGVISLGDSGVAVLSFDYDIFNGAGPDFAVFENGFSNPDNDTFAYLELAFVEVSSDGVNFFRFPATSAQQDTLQIDNFSYNDASKYNNLAGKYISGYGTPFDLEELKDIPGLDVNHITKVRIVDAIGTINPAFASRDKDGHIINESYASPYPSGGFDLNGVGVIHSLKPAPTAIASINQVLPVKLYPNPTENEIHLEAKGLLDIAYSLSDISGRQIMQGQFSNTITLTLNGRPSGWYLLHLQQGDKKASFKIIKK